MKLYKEEGVNPAASCLPLILQMPIFIGLFNVLNGGVERHRRWASSSSETSPDPRDVAAERERVRGQICREVHADGRRRSGEPSVWPAFLMIGMVVTLFFTQLHMMRKNMPPEALTGPMAQQQKTMLYMFPVIYLITGVSVPIGVMIVLARVEPVDARPAVHPDPQLPRPEHPRLRRLGGAHEGQGQGPGGGTAQAARYGLARPKATVSDDPTKVARQDTSRTTSGVRHDEARRRRGPPPAVRADAAALRRTTRPNGSRSSASSRTSRPALPARSPDPSPDRRDRPKE